MNASNSSGGDHAGVGMRIGEARRELGLTQAELATRIGVSFETLDRYETGRSDPADQLARIAEVTGRPVSWFSSSAPHRDGDEASGDIPASVGERIALSRAQRGLTQRELAEAVGVSLAKIERYESGRDNPAEYVERIAAALGEPNEWLETGETSARADAPVDIAVWTEGQNVEAEGAIDTTATEDSEAEPSPTPEVEPSRAALTPPPLQIPHEDLPRKALGYHPQAAADLFDEVADMYGRLWQEREALARDLESTHAELAEKSRRCSDAERAGAQLLAEVERVTADKDAVADLLERSRSELADISKQNDAETPAVSELEAKCQRAEQRATKAEERLAEAETELAHFQEQQRALAEAVVWARHAASTAEEEAKRIVRDAERQANELMSDGRRELEHLENERRRFETLTKEVQGDLSGFLLDTLNQLQEKTTSIELSDESTTTTTP